MVVNYFSRQNYPVMTVKERFTPEGKEALFDAIRKFPEAVVINCIGKIKQKTEDSQELMWANAVLPLALANELPSSQLLIHPSTDCVFSGMKGDAYSPKEVPDANDDYGWSKRLGEVALLGRGNTVIPRVSIIGPDKSVNPKGLLGWFLSQPEGAELKGFTNHLWNGITTLEWCKLMEEYISNRENVHLKKATIVQAGTVDHYSKFEMLELFAEAFQHRVKLAPYSTEVAVNRTLKPTVLCKDLSLQLTELVNFDA